MVDGLAQMAAQWLITGDFSAKAALSMMASIALSIATQAGMTAIMEYAKGMAEAAAAAASYAVGDVPGGVLHTQAAGLHFAAATVFGTVAAIAGGAGVGLALGARAAGAGGGSGGGSKGPQQQATNDRDDFRDTSPISRSDGRTYDSGSRPFEHTLAEIARHLIDVRASHDRVANALSTIETANVGDVFTRGEAARPLVVPSRVVKHLDSNAGFGTAIQRKTGGR